MLSEMKKELLKDPEKIKNILEHFGYCNVAIHNTYLSCGRDYDSSKKSIVIRLENNPYLWLTDYARNINQDMISYICNQRKIKFAEVLSYIKNVLGISDYYAWSNKKTGIFGGFYSRVKKRTGTSSLRPHNVEILNAYVNCPNARFLRDRISICSQKYFGVRYDVESQSIVIPIFDDVGQLVGVKARINKEAEDGEQKYYYLVQCQMSKVLFGYFQNYKYLTGNTVYVFESEKSVMQCFSYGIRNCVALGSGTVSKKQAQLLVELNPSQIIFMHDTGYEEESVMRNIEMVKRCAKFTDIEFGYWNYNEDEYPNKVSPSDLGAEKLRYIMENEIYIIGSDSEKYDEDEL